MCFSAGASFVSGIFISAIGVASVKKVYKPSQRVFAIIPLLFGIQQLAEGCLWLTNVLAGHNNGIVMSGGGSFLQTIPYFGMVLFCSNYKYFHLPDTQGVEKAEVIITKAGH